MDYPNYSYILGIEIQTNQTNHREMPLTNRTSSPLCPFCIPRSDASSTRSRSSDVRLASSATLDVSDEIRPRAAPHSSPSSPPLPLPSQLWFCHQGRAFVFHISLDFHQPVLRHSWWWLDYLLVVSSSYGGSEIHILQYTKTVYYSTLS